VSFTLARVAHARGVLPDALGARVVANAERFFALAPAARPGVG
jgi:hypothetical protein